MRKRVFEIIEAAREHDRLSNAYDIVMMVTIFASLVPMAFKQTNEVFDAIERTICCGCGPRTLSSKRALPHIFCIRSRPWPWWI